MQDWFIYRPEALSYLNKIAAEVRIVTSSDRMIAELRDKLRERHVRSVIWRRAHIGFHFEVDRGRPHKGYLYGVDYWRSRVALLQVGSENCAEMPCTLENLSGQHLLDAIREMLVESVLEM